MQCRLKNKKGFSALEAIFAVLILSFGFVGFMSMFSQMAKTTESDDMRLLASRLAGEKIEEIMATKASQNYSGVNVGTQEENINFDNYDFTRSTDIAFVDSSDLKTVVGGDSGYKRIHVTVSWNVGSTQSVRLMGLISNY